MAKKNFSGLSSLITGNIQPEETKPETASFLSFGVKRQSENKKLKGDKGYYRKTFLMDSELGDIIEAWAWYTRTKEKDIAEKAFSDYLNKLDQDELQKAVLGFKKTQK
jgi:hypothetical protein